MNNDPGIASDDSRYENLDTHANKTIEPRWKGGTPPFTPARVRAVERKRKLEKAQQAGIELSAFAGAKGKPSLLEVAPVIFAELAPNIAAAVLAQLRTPHRRIVQQLAGCKRAGLHGAIATRDEFRKLTELSETCTRRVLNELLKHGLVELVAPTVQYHAGGASSFRGNAYAVPDAVVYGSRAGSCSLVQEPTSGTEVPAEENPRGFSSCSPEENAGSCSSEQEPASPGAVSASPTKIFFRSAVPAASTGELWPVKRQGESSEAPPEAPEDDRWRELAELAAAGDAFAAELLEQIRKDRSLREAGLRTPWEHRQQRGAFLRSEHLDRAQREAGDL